MKSIQRCSSILGFGSEANNDIISHTYLDKNPTSPTIFIEVLITYFAYREHDCESTGYAE